MGPMGTYRVFGLGDKQMGGMMTATKGSPMPPMWIYYDGDSRPRRRARAGDEEGCGGDEWPQWYVPGGGRIRSS